jgi:hypothetical protein
MATVIVSPYRPGVRGARSGTISSVVSFLPEIDKDPHLISDGLKRFQQVKASSSRYFQTEQKV